MTNTTTITPDPDGDGFILHLPEFTHLDTQVWSADVGLTAEGLAALRAALVSPAAVEQPANQTTPSLRAGLRDRLAAAIWERQNPGRRYADCEHPWGADAEADADAVLAVLYREWPWLRAEAEDEQLRTDQAALRQRIAQALEEADYRPDMRRGDLADAIMPVLPEPADRAAVLNAAALHLYTALFPAVYDDMGQKAAEGVNRAVSELRRMADETATETQRRCPSCDHEAKYHAADDGRCWFTVNHGVPGANLVCPCIPRDPGDDEPAAGARQDGATP